MSTRSSYADLQIRILGKTTVGYPVELTLDWLQDLQSGVLDASILPWVPSTDVAADGERLFRWLTADPKLAAAWAEARGRRPNRRIRLRIDDAAPELHTLPWELLRDPGDKAVVPQFLAADDATPFSRHLVGRSPPGRPILQRPIRILVAVASPDGLAERRLSPVDVTVEWQTLNSALAGLEVELELFPRPGSGFVTRTREGEPVTIGSAPQPCTLAALELALRTGRYHVLHFIGHGAYDEQDSQAALYMADENNRVERVLDADFAEMLGRLLSETDAGDDDRLRLVYLAACQSATRSPADAFRGLAPKLIAAGVPAVIAMQDAVQMDTARAFSGSFYTHLLRYGQVDRAANAARASLLSAGIPGAAIPVLFMRLADGRLLGQRGEILGDRASSFWTALLSKIATGKCVPFLGPGVGERLLPTPVELAQQLAREYSYPFPATQSLPRVAQFVGSIDEDALRTRLLNMMIQGFLGRMELSAQEGTVTASLSKVIRDGKWLDRSLERLEGELHQQLAELGLPLYVTTNADGFMAQALEAMPRPPGHAVRRLSLNWRGELSGDPERPHWDVDPPLSREDPVVYHLFGTDEDPSSMVLTEDDFLDYLSRISRDHEYLLPTSIQDALAQYTLLFLGYRLEDLDLKVILRGLLPRLNLSQFKVLRVAAQIESEIVDDAKIEEVTAYFQRYFTESRIEIYWGTTQQFVNELYSRWREQNHG
jgi:hypothetical protein